MQWNGKSEKQKLVGISIPIDDLNVSVSFNIWDGFP